MSAVQAEDDNQSGVLGGKGEAFTSVCATAAVLLCTIRKRSESFAQLPLTLVRRGPVPHTVCALYTV